ncbi:MAG: NAD(P)/FAD-dependent oxidoreductase, partial [Candidatus Omnitrophica bacterium]|nr:NAD(P)/FAD-dependent oxidoreductase [Candidatus Omnitrophota bacterium]
CNLTNNCPIDDFFPKYGRDGFFLRDAFNVLSNTALVHFFESRGLRTIVNDNGKIFPWDESAKSVLLVLEKELAKRKVRTFLGSPVLEIISEKERLFSVKAVNGSIATFDRVILATGGVSYPETGSTGDGYKMAERLGHTIIPPRPALVAVIVKENYPASLMGLSLSGISLTIFNDTRKIFSGKGDLVFTAKGVSGPLVLSNSGMISERLSRNAKLSLSIDQFPEIPRDKFDRTLSDHLTASSSKNARNAMRELVPERLAELFLDISGISGGKISNQITRKERMALSSLLKDLHLTIIGTLPIREAMVTRGGVSLKEIDPKTMASRIVKGLYLAGEVIDIDGDTGGFNLQAAFSTGYLAGLSAGRIEGS